MKSQQVATSARQNKNRLCKRAVAPPMLAASPPLNLVMAEEPTRQMQDIMIDNDFSFIFVLFV